MSRFSSALRPGRVLPLAALASGSAYAYTLSADRVAYAEGVKAGKIDEGLRATPTSDLIRSWVVYKIWCVPCLVAGGRTSCRPVARELGWADRFSTSPSPSPS